MTGILTQAEQHTVQVQRLATRLLNANVYPSLTEAYKAARLILLDAGEITSITQLNKITRDINKAVVENMNSGWAATTQGLDEFSLYEASFYASLIGSTSDVDLTVPAETKIANFIKKSLLSLQSGSKATSGTWAQLVNQNTLAMVKDYDNAVRASFANSETVNQAAARLKAVTEGLSKSEATSLARTGIQHYAIQAQEAVHQENQSVIKAYEYVAVLDNRTTTLCGGRDGNQYRKGEKRPELPAHFNCRSQYLAIVIGEDDLEGRRTAVGGRKGDSAKDAYELRKERKRIDGKVKRRGRKDDSFFDPSQVNAKTNYQKWFIKQPVWWQESAIGKTRASLVRNGGMKISKFNDMTGRQLSLDELRALDAEAFARAGV